MSDFKSNSEKSKQLPKPEPRKMGAVAESSVKKREGFAGILDGLMARNKREILNYVIESVVLPGVSNGIDGIGGIITSSLIEGVGELFRNAGYSADERRYKSDRTSYSGYYKKSATRYSRDETEKRETMTYDNVRVRNRGQAERVIDQLRINIKEDGYATVAQLFELVDQIPNYTDAKYGWDKLDSADWVRVNDYEYPYLLKFPKPRPIDEL